MDYGFALNRIFSSFCLCFSLWIIVQNDKNRLHVIEMEMPCAQKSFVAIIYYIIFFRYLLKLYDSPSISCYIRLTANKCPYWSSYIIKKHWSFLIVILNEFVKPVLQIWLRIDIPILSFRSEISKWLFTQIFDSIVNRWALLHIGGSCLSFSGCYLFLVCCYWV